MDRAKRSYARNDFNDALYACKLAFQENDCDGTAYYMYALCLHRLGKLGEAQTAYLKVMQNFPDTEASEQAQAGLVAITGRIPTTGTDKPSETPRKVHIAFRVEGKSRIIQVDVNGKRVDMDFDEDAKQTTLTEKAIAMVGLKKDEKSQKMTAKLTAGLLVRPNFQVELGERNVLSRAFFDGYKYIINDGGTVIQADRMSKLDVGTGLYNKGDIKGALENFSLAVRSNPNDSEALYSRAICLHKLGKVADAKSEYYKILNRFPKTDAFFMSQTALNQIDPSGLDAWRKSKIGASVASGANLKAMEKVKQGSEVFEVPFVWEDTNMMVMVNVDGLRTNAYVDPTGVQTYFSTEQMKQIDPNYLSDLAEVKFGANAGSDAPFRGGTIKLDRIQLGRIERRKFPVAVVDNIHPYFPWRTWGKTARPVLGKGFWIGWDMDIDQVKKMFLFKKKQGPNAINQ